MRFVFPILLFGACSGSVQESVELGGALPGLSTVQRAAFERGKALFEKRFLRSEGHGPDFNTSSCAACHEIPVTGGSSPLYRNFYLATRDGIPAFEGSQLVARTFSYERRMREAIPSDADEVAQRNAPPIFGVGLFLRISDQEILANHDPFDGDNDGISGTVNFDLFTVGRFGYKAQEADLEDFVRGPIFNHMGITTDPLSFGSGGVPQVAAPQEPTTDDDGVPDPELGHDDLAALVAFTGSLAPPAPLPMDDIAERGELFFGSIGCARCHIPSLVQDGEPILAYTDLLLHDLGPGLADGIRMGSATGSEFRTQPLWGLRHHAPYLHDGRADTIEDAILLHGGEAQAARDAFAALGPSDRGAILRFLETR